MSNDLNSVVIIGRLTRDAEIKYSTTGTATARFSIANTQSRKDGDRWIEEAHFFECVLFGKRAEALQRYLVKGQQVAIQGTLTQSRWTDKQTGANRSAISIKIDDIQLTEKRRNSGSQSQQQPSYDAGQYHSSSDDFEDDMPF